jgi:endoglucanase
MNSSPEKVAQDFQNAVKTAPFNTAIKVCQVGFLPSETKMAMVTADTRGDAMLWRKGSEKPALVVPVGSVNKDSDSGDEIRSIDFSALKTPGEYTIEVKGLGKSAPFRIGKDVFSHAFRLAIRGFTGQRASTDVSLAPDFPQYHYKAGHTAVAQYHEPTGKTGTRNVSGGWYDAGDYGRYVVNSGITTGTLLWAYELNSTKLSKIKLDIPETGKSKLPDFLSEVKVNLDWMLKMQDTDGGVWHKATTAGFSGFIMPDQDKGLMLVIGTGKGAFKNTTATADLAAVAAIGARVFRPFDREYANKCLDAARSAYEWTRAHPSELFNNPKGISTGGYGDSDARDERLWAAAELFRSTGEASFQDDFIKLAKEWPDTITDSAPPGWPQVRPMALMTFAMTSLSNVDKAFQTRIKSDLSKADDGITARVNHNGYCSPLKSTEYYWGSNSVVANYALMLQVANHLKPNATHKQAALDCLHYLLGRNTFATSFVTHVGVHYAMNPHHRWSVADGVAEPWPGLLVGGPNADNGMKPPAKQWFDDWKNYRVNEIAINWNAPLVFVLADVLP